jgi:hypothetical protein
MVSTFEDWLALFQQSFNGGPVVARHLQRRASSNSTDDGMTRRIDGSTDGQCTRLRHARDVTA